MCEAELGCLPLTQLVTSPQGWREMALGGRTAICPPRPHPGPQPDPSTPGFYTQIRFQCCQWAEGGRGRRLTQKEQGSDLWAAHLPNIYLVLSLPALSSPEASVRGNRVLEEEGRNQTTLPSPWPGRSGMAPIC